MPKTALIFGITGQIGSYLAELLLFKNYTVHGVIRRSSSFNTQRIEHIFNRLQLHYGDLHDFASVATTIASTAPDEVYNLAAQSHVRVSFDMPAETGIVTGIGVTNILEAVRRFAPKAAFYQASSSEMFGSAPAPQNEQTPFIPQSPYAAAKLYGYHMTRNYRDAYGLFACNGICFNAESPRRGETFVTRKITRAVAKAAYEGRAQLALGNREAKRDWGFAGDYAKAMWLLLQQPRADDYIIATGVSHSVEEFLRLACKTANVGPEQLDVTFDPRLLRPTEVPHLQGTAEKLKKLGWAPEMQFEELVSLMVHSDIEHEKRCK